MKPGRRIRRPGAAPARARASSEAADGSPADSRIKAVVRLLRYLGAAACRLETPPDETHIVVQRPGAEPLAMQHAVLGEAVARGLVLHQSYEVRAAPEASAFIRRFMAAREEAFLDQHRRIEIVAVATADGGFEPARLNAAESPLAQLARLRDRAGAAWFPPQAIAAGERLARDFQFASLQPKITARYEPRLGGAPGNGGADLRDDVVAARLRVSKAIEAMGPELSGVALDICCFEKGLETVERERLWPARSAKLMLKTALLQLARYYDPPAQAQRRIHHWGGDGFRPDLKR